MTSVNQGKLPLYQSDTQIYFSSKPNCGSNEEDEVLIRFPSVQFPRIPLISRSKSSVKSGDLGYGTTRIDVTLDCFVTGDRHSDIVAQYEILENVFDRNDLYMWYISGNGDHKVINGVRVYISKFNEPSDWKQHKGRYSVGLYYFKNVCDYDSFGISASYDQTSLESYDPDNPNGQEPQVSYAFNPCPLWSSDIEKVNGEPTASEFTPYGEVLKKNRTIILTGMLKADHYENYIVNGVPQDGLKTKIDKLHEAFSRHGVLNYGDWTRQVYIESGPTFETSLPHCFARYSIRLKCHEDEIYELKCTRDFTRTHHFAKVDDRLYCLKTEVDEFHESGQYVDYSMTLKAKTREKARELLRKELGQFVTPGGVEMRGGKERWLNDRTISISLKKFYVEAILPNVEDIDEEDNILGSVRCNY